MRKLVALLLSTLLLVGVFPRALAAATLEPLVVAHPVLLAPEADALLTSSASLVVGLDGPYGGPTRVELRVIRVPPEPDRPPPEPVEQDDPQEPEVLATVFVDEPKHTEDGPRWTTPLPAWVLPNEKVRIEVRAADEDASPGEWRGHEVTLDLAPPATTVTAEQVPDTLAVDVAWTPMAIPDLTDYTLERATADGDFSAIETFGPDPDGVFPTSYRDSEVPTVALRYRVTATRPSLDGTAQRTSSSDPVEVTVVSPPPEPTSTPTPTPTPPPPEEPEPPPPPEETDPPTPPEEPEPPASEPEPAQTDQPEPDPEPTQPQPTTPDEPVQAPEEDESDDDSSTPDSGEEGSSSGSESSSGSASSGSGSGSSGSSGQSRVADSPSSSLTTSPEPPDDIPLQSLLSLSELDTDAPMVAASPFDNRQPESVIAAPTLTTIPQADGLTRLPTAALAVLPPAPGGLGGSGSGAQAEASSEPLRLLALVFCAFILGRRRLRPAARATR